MGVERKQRSHVTSANRYGSNCEHYGYDYVLGAIPRTAETRRTVKINQLMNGHRIGEQLVIMASQPLETESTYIGEA